MEIYKLLNGSNCKATRSAVAESESTNNQKY